MLDIEYSVLKSDVIKSFDCTCTARNALYIHLRLDSILELCPAFPIDLLGTIPNDFI